MKTETEVENILRHAPQPQPAPQLARALKSRISLPAAANGAGVDLETPLWRRWIPALAYAVLILGCVVVLAVQSNQQQELLHQNEQLRSEIAMAQDAAAARGQARAKLQSGAREMEQLKRDAAEADRLAERLAGLQAQIAALNTQAKDLNAQLAAVPEIEKVIAPYDFFGEGNPALKDARGKAASIACINNLKQIGLAFRIWANDNNGWFPPNLNSLSNELSVAVTLCCPNDEANLKLAKSVFASAGVPAGDQSYYQRLNAAWARWPMNGGSYEMLTANIDSNAEGAHERVLARCRIHGHYVLGDGSAHMVKTTEENP